MQKISLIKKQMPLKSAVFYIINLNRQYFLCDKNDYNRETMLFVGSLEQFFDQNNVLHVPTCRSRNDPLNQILLKFVIFHRKLKCFRLFVTLKKFLFCSKFSKN